MNHSKTFSGDMIQQEGDCYVMSTYTGELTNQGMAKAVSDIKKSFPTLDEGFYEVFLDMIKSSKFDDERLIDAVTHVIATCVYPQPTIAQFISFDRKIKMWTYAQMIDETDRNQTVFKQRTPVKIDGQTFYVMLEDAAKYGFQSTRLEE